MKDHILANVETLDELTMNICSELKSNNIVKLNLGDFSKYIPTYGGGSELEPADLRVLRQAFSERGLETHPRIRDGFINLGLESPLLLFSAHGDFDHKSENYRYGLLLVQVAVIFARIDGHIADLEISQIERMLVGLSFLSKREKTELTAQAHYYLSISASVGGSEQVRKHIRVCLSKDFALKRMSLLSDAAKSTLIEVAKSVVTADGIIQKNEVEFLQDMYREFGKSARSVRPELERFANEHYIPIHNENIRDYIETEILEEIDDLLGGLISEFDEDSSYVN